MRCLRACTRRPLIVAACAVAFLSLAAPHASAVDRRTTQVLRDLRSENKYLTEQVASLRTQVGKLEAEVIALRKKVGEQAGELVAWRSPRLRAKMVAEEQRRLAAERAEREAKAKAEADARAKAEARRAELARLAREAAKARVFAAPGLSCTWGPVRSRLSESVRRFVESIERRARRGRSRSTSAAYRVVELEFAAGRSAGRRLAASTADLRFLLAGGRQERAVEASSALKGAYLSQYLKLDSRERRMLERVDVQPGTRENVLVILPQMFDASQLERITVYAPTGFVQLHPDDRR